MSCGSSPIPSKLFHSHYLDIIVFCVFASHSRKPKEADSSKRLKELTENEKKTAGKVPKETPEELQECEAVFQDF